MTPAEARPAPEEGPTAAEPAAAAEPATEGELAAPQVAKPEIYPQARFLCDQRVYSAAGPGVREIHWSLYGSADAVEKIAAYYGDHGGQTEVDDPPAQTFSFADGVRVTIFPASARDQYPSCGVDPKAKEVTLIMLSQAFR